MSAGIKCPTMIGTEGPKLKTQRWHELHTTLRTHVLCEKVERKDVEIGERTGKAEEHKRSEREEHAWRGIGEGRGNVVCKTTKPGTKSSNQEQQSSN